MYQSRHMYALFMLILCVYLITYVLTGQSVLATIAGYDVTSYMLINWIFVAVLALVIKSVYNRQDTPLYAMIGTLQSNKGYFYPGDWVFIVLFLLVVYYALHRKNVI